MLVVDASPVANATGKMCGKMGDEQNFSTRICLVVGARVLWLVACGSFNLKLDLSADVKYHTPLIKSVCLYTI